MNHDSRPDHTPKPEEVDPEEGTEPDGTPVENPSGVLGAAPLDLGTALTRP